MKGPDTFFVKMLLKGYGFEPRGGASLYEPVGRAGSDPTRTNAWGTVMGVLLF